MPQEKEEQETQEKRALEEKEKQLQTEKQLQAEAEVGGFQRITNALCLKLQSTAVAAKEKARRRRAKEGGARPEGSS